MSGHTVGECDAVLLAGVGSEIVWQEQQDGEQLIVRDTTHGSLARVHIRLQLSIEVVRLVASHVHPDTCRRKAGQLT